MLSFAHIVGFIAALTLIYFVVYPAAWYIWDPLKLRRFPAPSFLASISPLWLMTINASEKRSYRVHEAHQKLGPIIRVGPNTVYFNEPQAVNDIYGHKAASKIIKDAFYDRLAGDYHDIVQERDRGEHSRKRKYLAHAFALKTVVEMEPVIRVNAMNLIARIEDFIDMAGNTKERPSNGQSQTFNIRAWLNYFTLDVIGDMAFGLPMGFLRAGSDAKPAQSRWGKEYTVPSMIKALHHGVRYSIVLAQITSLHLHSFIGSIIGCSRYLSSRLGATDSVDFENISLHQLQRRLDKGATDRPSRDFIGHIIADKAGSARDLPFGEMVAEAVVMMNAGSDTTAAALTNTVFYLLSNPACLKQLREELESAVPIDHLHNDTLVKYDYVRTLPYLRACIDESLRLRPPITYPLPRLIVAPEGAVIAGHHFQKGIVVAVSPYTMHRNSTIYKDPEAYEPGRWFDLEQSANLKAYNIPFSTGSRACIGRHIAIVELQILISTLVLRYDMQLENQGQELDVFERFNANPGPLPVKIVRRAI